MTHTVQCPRNVFMSGWGGGGGSGGTRSIHGIDEIDIADVNINRYKNITVVQMQYLSPVALK